MAERVAFCALEAQQVVCLCRLLSSAGIETDAHPGPFSALTGLCPDTPILTGSQAFREADLRQIEDLRTQRLVWSPVVWLDWAGEAPEVREAWALAPLELPCPWNDLLAALDNAKPVSEPRRRQLLEGEVLAQVQEVGSWLRASQQHGLELGALMAEVQRIAGEARAAGISEELAAPLEDFLALGTVDAAALSRLAAAVRELNGRLRQRGLPPALASALHDLKNDLSHETWRQTKLLTDPGARAADWISRLTPEDWSLLAAWEAPLRELGRVLQVPVDLSKLGRALSEFHQAQYEPAAAARRPSRARPGRILVVEDDDAWRGSIVACLEEVALHVSVVSVSTYQEAEDVLARHAAPLLVLTDMGLPQDEAAAAKRDVDLEAGLRLIQESRKRGEPHRFMVLTAATDYPEIVRQARLAGVDASDYIEKDQHVWEEQLRSRVVLAMSAVPAPRQPVLEVLSYTGQTIRLDGIEIPLTRKPFLLLDCLAFHCRRGWEVEVCDLISYLEEDWPDFAPAGREIERKDINEHLSTAKQLIATAFADAGRPSDVPELVVYDREKDTYTVCAQVQYHEEAPAEGTTWVTPRALVVEDEPRWRADIAAALMSLGFEVREAPDLDTALRVLEGWPPDVVSLDLQIPRDGSGTTRPDEANSLTLLRALRHRVPEARVAVLTSIEWRTDVMLGLLREGVNVAHYLSKSWSDPIDRLCQSLWVLAREQQQGVQIVQEVAGLPSRFTISADDPPAFTVAGQPLPLAGNRARAFRLLAEHVNSAVTRERLRDAIWPDVDDWPEDCDASLNSLMKHLRRDITKASQGQVDGNAAILSGDGVYRLRGIVDRG